LSGYTPVFDSVFQGTLCGKWPTLPVWLTILPMADKSGCIDMTYQAMSALSGWPIDLLKQAITELCAPDPESRSATADGRRLELIDPDNRTWGWRVVNHGKYREKARKSAYDSDRTASGRDAERKRAENESREVPRSPDASRDLPLSDTNTNTVRERKRSSRRCPKEFEPDLAFALAELPDLDAEAEAAKFKDCEFKSPKTDWAATWRNWVRTCKERGTYARRAPKSQGLHAGVVMR
jgi:hypothetical protein